MAATGLRASYHRLMNKIEFILPVKLRPLYNHPAGLVWSRYSLVIIPKNWSLFAVNFFLGCAGGSQLYRIWNESAEKECSRPKKQCPAAASHGEDKSSVGTTNSVTLINQYREYLSSRSESQNEDDDDDDDDDEDE
ncbi:UNVERIFIED_CONTAM: hypothetical protein FKN15_003984 [Acipenser sinensis]